MTDQAPYQVFAVKTRPQTFGSVIGQDPIITAIQHALAKNRLHHAYLFTGTRGVGKTTIARIIAKALNCEQGVSQEPCNICNNCLSITAGSFPDLIEIDAASRTKVEDTRALLDTVIYAPTQGRYKIYLIDEVHMLSTHSFNALLKTLEEPPEYVKFLLATTELHKIPATIVSRCLQFTLKWVDQEVITKHLVNILEQDKITYELPGLNILAQAAQGSVRDSLSLLEQAVAIGGGEVTTQNVRLMLGRTPGAEIINLLDNLISRDSQKLIQQFNQLAVSGIDFAQFLILFISYLHQIAVFQQAPELSFFIDSELQNDIHRLAKAILPEDIQIYYQIALLAKRDLPCSPQPRLAVEMALIRMLNFVPVQATATPFSSSKLAQTETTRAGNNNQEPQKHSVSIMPAEEPGSIVNTQNWPNWLNKLELKALSLQLVKNCVFSELSNDSLTLNLDQRFSTLLNSQRQQEIEARIQTVLNKKIKLIIKLNNLEAIGQTPARLEQESQQKKHADFVVKLQNDPNIANITKIFNGELRPDLVELTDE
ncbi:MAG: DNA polymerase III subunit gamma/tau [Gammaproteobacteria bacterium]|nr:DNA polymerase III subunit gamma/tau [Gammaproteobacteria bacterium]